MTSVSRLLHLFKNPRSRSTLLQETLKILQPIRARSKKPVTAFIFAIVLYSAIRYVLSLSKSDTSSLKSALWFSEHEILFFSAIVVVGCVGESLETEWWKARHAIFAIWVALGVTGEAFADAEVYTTSAALQSAADMAIDAAKRDAANAIGRAADVQREAAPRDISPPKTFALEYAAEHNHLIVLVSSYSFDAESGRLATQVVKRLIALGIEVQDDTMGTHALKPIAFGVQVTGPNNDIVADLTAWCDESNLLRPPPEIDPERTVSIISREGVQEFPETQDATIFVGAKPLPPGDP